MSIGAHKRLHRREPQRSRRVFLASGPRGLDYAKILKNKGFFRKWRLCAFSGQVIFNPLLYQLSYPARGWNNEPRMIRTGRGQGKPDGG